MDDDFLSQFREAPQQEFAEAVQRRFSRPSPKTFRFGFWLRRTGLGFVMLCALASVVFVASPAARAQVQALIYNIAGYSINTETQINAGEQFSTPQISEVDLAEIERKIGQKILLPSYTPIITKPITVHSVQPQNSRQVTVIWGTPDAYVNVSVSPRVSGEQKQFAVGQAQLTEIHINGKPAMFAKNIGYLDVDAEGKSTGKIIASTGKMIMWQIGNSDYTVGSSGNISDEDLIKMAESVQ